MQFAAPPQPFGRYGVYCYFACTDFRKPGSKDEYYDIDFWVNDKSGKLEVANVKMHKVPVQEDGIWTQVPRYTFDGMDIEVAN